MLSKTCLPLPKGYRCDDKYVNDLLSFVTSNKLFKQLCGGVHILDFFTSSPSLYDSLLEESWRTFFASHDLNSLLHFLLREDLSPFQHASPDRWREQSPPPASLVSYLAKIRSLTLRRERTKPEEGDQNVLLEERAATIPRNLAVGMQVKKVHEVESFARYVQKLSDNVSDTTNRSLTHFIDFGSGQNYLGRTLASAPYNKHVIAVESKPHNVEGARAKDVKARLAQKQAPNRNKKQFRQGIQERARREGRDWKDVLNEALKADKEAQRKARQLDVVERDVWAEAQDHSILTQKHDGRVVRAKLDCATEGTGSVQYVEHRLQDGYLRSVIDEIIDEPAIQMAVQKDSPANDEVPTRADGQSSSRRQEPNLMVMSIHSCGNLSHHGLRSLVLNESVSVVALIGCCYNLVTERLTATARKVPGLTSLNEREADGDGSRGRLETVGSSDKYARSAGGDAHGFPMSSRLCNYPTAHSSGVLLNITARMMGLQAPMNWEADGHDTFFIRHFYRALVQKIFVDRGIVEHFDESDSPEATETERGSASTQAVIIGSLRKKAYKSFVSYVRAAVDKLSSPGNHHPSLALTGLPQLIAEKMADITDDEIRAYETEYQPRMKDLCIVWTLMAYSAQLVEAVMVVDRWLWLKEQPEVERCWVENVFDYSKSPRNLVVVGVKKMQGGASGAAEPGP